MKNISNYYWIRLLFLEAFFDGYKAPAFASPVDFFLKLGFALRLSVFLDLCFLPAWSYSSYSSSAAI